MTCVHYTELDPDHWYPKYTWCRVVNARLWIYIGLHIISVQVPTVGLLIAVTINGNRGFISREESATTGDMTAAVFHSIFSLVSAKVKDSRRRERTTSVT